MVITVLAMMTVATVANAKCPIELKTVLDCKPEKGAPRLDISICTNGAKTYVVAKDSKDEDIKEVKPSIRTGATVYDLESMVFTVGSRPYPGGVVLATLSPAGFGEEYGAQFTCKRGK